MQLKEQHCANTGNSVSLGKEDDNETAAALLIGPTVQVNRLKPSGEKASTCVKPTFEMKSIGRKTRLLLTTLLATGKQG
jgi:hypothetical protein